MTSRTSSMNLAIAGFGWWGQHMATRLANHPLLRVVGIVEPVADHHAAIAEKGLAVWTDLAEPLADGAIDAVILTTPNPLHETQVIAAAEAGKHVFCEKPLGLSAASARRSVAACRQAGVQLGIGHERRFEPAMIALKAAIDGGELGRIMHAEAAFSHDKLIHVPKGDWRTKKAISPAAGMTAMGIHLSDLLVWFFGRVATVQAMTTSRSLGWETGDVVTVQLGFEAGMTASFSAVLHTPHFIRMQVFGTQQWTEIRNDSHPDTPGGMVRVETAETGKPARRTTYEWVDAVTDNLVSFARAARGEAAYAFTFEEMLHNIELLEAITLSAEERRTVTVDSI